VRRFPAGSFTQHLNQPDIGPSDLAAILTAVFFPFLAALAVPYFAERYRRSAAWFAMTAPLVSLAAVGRLYGDWAAGGGKALLYTLPWAPSANVEVSFLVDGLSLLWGFLVAGMGVFTVLYSNWYLYEGSALGRYYGFLIAFMGSMLGVVFADHLIALFVFWELTSITSYFLIGFWWERKESVYGAQKAILITGGGGLALLGAFLLLGGATGEWRLSALLARPDPAAVTPAVFFLVLIGAATKSAQWPFHIWLPNAMEAPTPISAFLHSATMVKAGIYLLSRFYPLLGGHPAWGYAVPALGMASMIAGGILSLRATDLKAILAYGTISQLGLIVTFLGFGGEAAVVGGTLHLYNHAVAKAALFMVAGIIHHESGTRDVRSLGKLRKPMPCTHAIAVVAAISLIGIPPMGGFITKEMLYESSLLPGGPGPWGAFWPWLTLAAGIVTALYHLRFLGATFWERGEEEPPKHPHDPPLGMLAAPAVLAFLALVLGLAPGLIQNALIAPAAAATLGRAQAPVLNLALWHGLNVPLLMSAVTIAAGILLYAGFGRVALVLEGGAALWRRGPGPDKAYDGLIRWAQDRTWPLLTALQDGNLRRYLRWTMAAPVLLLLYAAAQLDWRPGIWPDMRGVAFLPAAVCALIIAASFATALFPRRIPAILALGTTGYAISALYLMLKAPDLALTQIMIESASVVLFLLVFWYLPELEPVASTVGRRVRDWTIALSLGGAATAGMALAMNSHEVRTVADYFMRTSKPIAGFKNVVNAIIVDYRGYDTLGEITVLVIAGVAIYAMTRLTGEPNCNH